MIKYVTIFLIFFGSLLTAHGQDIHQTDYRLNPLLLNPAKTGSYSGTGRVGLIYRDQFRPFIQEAFQTPAVFVDSPVMYGLKKNHWVGIGLLLYSDNAGALGYKTTGTHLSGAYHIGLNKEMDRVLTVGVQYGQVSKTIKDAEMAVFADELMDPSTLSPDQSFVDGFDVSYSDIGLGFMFTSPINDRSGFQLGGAVSHIAIPSKAKGLVYLRWNVHATYSYDVSSRFRVEPTIYYSAEKTTAVFSPQLNTSYQINPEKSFRLKSGVGYRSEDAIQFLIGASFNDWTIGIAYDLTVSAAAEATNNFGALEFGVNKIFKLYKEPQVDPIIFCPRF